MQLDVLRLLMKGAFQWHVQNELAEDLGISSEKLMVYDKCDMPPPLSSAMDLLQRLVAHRLLLPEQEALKRLPDEKKAREAHVRSIDRLLTRAMAVWKCDRRGMLHQYLQQCVLLRVRYSPADAAYCAKFTQRLHELAVPFFPTILYFDTVSDADERPFVSSRPTSCHFEFIPSMIYFIEHFPCPPEELLLFVRLLVNIATFEGASCQSQDLGRRKVINASVLQCLGIFQIRLEQLHF